MSGDIVTVATAIHVKNARGDGGHRAGQSRSSDGGTYREAARGGGTPPCYARACISVRLADTLARRSRIERWSKRLRSAIVTRVVGPLKARADLSTCAIERALMIAAAFVSIGCQDGETTVSMPSPSSATDCLRPSHHPWFRSPEGLSSSIGSWEKLRTFAPSIHRKNARASLTGRAFVANSKFARAAGRRGEHQEEPTVGVVLVRGLDCGLTGPIEVFRGGERGHSLWVRQGGYGRACAEELPMVVELPQGRDIDEVYVTCSGAR